jgi:N-acetylmuramoyl-L-alanine amidase
MWYTFFMLSRRSLLAAPLPPAAAGRRPLPLVILDPGHGGRDPGAIGAAGTEEKRVALAVALTLRQNLETGGRCRVALTREADVFVPLQARLEAAQAQSAALLVSLHADAAPPGPGPAVRGGSLYTLSETPSDAIAAGLAQSENAADLRGGLALPSVSPEVQQILLSLLRRETRIGSERAARLAVAELGRAVPLLAQPHRRAAFVVLKAPDVPALLVEMGFLSDPADEAALRRPGHRAAIAAALARAIRRYLDRGLG